MDEEAKTLGKRAAEQAKHAAKNGEKAIEFIAEDVAEEATRMDGLELVRGFGALCVAGYAAAYGVSKLRQAFIGR